MSRSRRRVKVVDGQETFVHDALKSNAAGIHVQITKTLREREKRKGVGCGS
jgi:hypothetical protein